MILHNERDLAILEAGLVTIGGGLLATLLAVCVCIALFKGKYQKRRNLVISLLGSTGVLFPLVYAWWRVREFYGSLVDRSPDLVMLMVAYASVLALTVAGPIVQHWLRGVSTIPDPTQSPT